MKAASSSKAQPAEAGAVATPVKFNPVAAAAKAGAVIRGFFSTGSKYIIGGLGLIFVAMLLMMVFALALGSTIKTPPVVPDPTAMTGGGSNWFSRSWKQHELRSDNGATITPYYDNQGGVQAVKQYSDGTVANLKTTDNGSKAWALK